MSPFRLAPLLRPPTTLQFLTAAAALLLLPPLLTAVPAEQRPGVAFWASAAVLFDLTLSALGLGWWTQKRSPAGAGWVLPTLLMGLGLAGAVLPEWRSSLWLGAALLGSGYVGTRRPVPEPRRATPLEHRTAQFARFLPYQLAASLAHDTLLWPGLWRQEVQVLPDQEVFTSHLRTGRAAYIWLYVFSEIPLHLGIHAALAPQGDEGWAALLTAADLLFTLWLAALNRSFARFPLLVGKEGLSLQQGLLWSGYVPLEAVQEVALWADPSATRLTLLTAPNFTLTLTREVTLRGPFGLTRRAWKFTLFVDDPAGLRRVLDH